MSTNLTPDESPAPWVNALLSAMPDGTRLELVRLADVVRWMMKTKRMHFAIAAQDTHKALAGLTGLELYFLTDAGGVAAIPPTHTFNLTDSNSRGGLPSKLPDGVTPGLSAALFYVGRVWGDGRNSEAFLARKDQAATWLAMPCAKAAQLWGGVVVPNAEATVHELKSVKTASDEPTTWRELVAFRKKHPRTDWSVEQKRIVKKEKLRRCATPGASGVAKAMALELNITETMVNKRITRSEILGKREELRKKAG